MKHTLRLFFIIAVGWGAAVAAAARQFSHAVVYDEEDGVPHHHVTQLLQDRQGFMWFATWNGLCRYDGYDFVTVKSRAGDGCQMATDRFRDIALRPDDKIICRIGDDDYYLFDTRTYAFSRLTGTAATQAATDIKRYRMSQAIRGDGQQTSFAYTDRQGNRWTLGAMGISKEIRSEQNIHRLDISPKAEVKCLFADRQGRYWVATKGDGAVRVYSAADDRLAGYLGADGQLHRDYTRFGAAVYCMYQSADGTLWLGSKPDGLYRLRPMADGRFRIDHLTATLPGQNVYHVASDRQGRLWVATLGGGLCYTDEPQADAPRFRVPRGYPKQVCQRVRYLQFTPDGRILLAATTDGLVVARLEPQADRMVFRRHQREADRVESLSSSATMDIVYDPQGRLLVSTESGGINRVESSNLLADTLVFSHLTAANHLLPSDVVMSMAAMDRQHTITVGSHLVGLLDSAGHFRQFDNRYFHADCRFSDARPLPLSGRRWLFGLQDGAFVTSASQMFRTAYQPKVVLTSVSIQGGDNMRAVTTVDTLTLQPRERSVTVRFAAIDYSAPERISYAFRLLPGEQWNYIGHDRSATLLDLSPGTYRLEIRSTDSEGQWTDNTRRLTIIVLPTFWESAWGRLLIVLLIVATATTIVYTFLYIRRIKRQQHETLEKYLALIETDKGRQPTAASPQTEKEDPMLQRVMQFIEENISNSDASVGDMAAAAAISRSGLQRKLKQTMGITPQDLLREARIKRASQLLRTTGHTVADVAYACGFTDPKYFSRCFKQHYGMSPTEYVHAASVLPEQ